LQYKLQSHNQLDWHHTNYYLAATPHNQSISPLKPPMPPQGDLDFHRYAEQLRNRIDNAQTYTREKIALAITRQRMNYTQDAKEIHIGEKVWLFTPVTRTGQSRKLAKFWSGPWIVTHRVNDIFYNIVTAPEMESTAPPQTVPVDRLHLYRMPAAPAVLLPQTESRAAAQAKDDDDDDFMEYIPMNQAQQPQLLPHQPPPPAHHRGHHSHRTDRHQGNLRHQDHNNRKDNRRPRRTNRDLLQEEHFSDIISRHRAMATGTKNRQEISGSDNKKGRGVHMTHEDLGQDQHTTPMQDLTTQEDAIGRHHHHHHLWGQKERQEWRKQT
jgi:hypothetical protein